MEEVLIKSHLIVTNIHDQYDIDWCGKIKDARPKFRNGKPIFAIVGGRCRMELNTTDMARIEKCAKLCTKPKGRAAVTTDTARIFIVEENDNERLIGIVTHKHIKDYAPMYDPVYLKN